MGLSSSKSKTTTDQKTSEQATTTPTNPQFVTDAIQGLAGQIGAYGKTDPLSHVAGPSALQSQAFGQAQNLGGWQSGSSQAQGLASAAAGAPANLASAAGYAAPAIQANQLGAASLYTPQTMTAANAATRGYDPFTAGNVGQAALAQFSAPKLGDAATYTGQGYTAATAAAQQAQASRAADYMGAYNDPYQKQVVDAYLADFDNNAGKVRAQQAAAAARNGAFAGNRYGLQEGETEGQLARARASGLGDILSKGFQFSAQMGDADANRFTTTSGLNAQLGTQANIANAGFQNDASRFSADALNRSNEFNANAKNSFTLQQGQMDFGAASQNAQAANTNNMFNTGQQNEALFRNQDALNTAAQFGANAFNQGSIANAGFQQQAGMANMDATNQAAQFGANAFNANQLAQFGADNQRSLAQADLNAQAAQFGQAAFNANNMFNAQQADAALARQLQAAGLLGELSNNFAANQRADIGLQADLGSAQRGIEQDRLNAPVAQLGQLGQLYGGLPLNLFNGQSVSSNGTTNGTSTTTSTPSLFSQALAAAQTAAAFSDRRLKRDVEQIDALENGLGVYRFAYLWDEGPAERIGVMADEVARIVPEALGPVIAGYATVDYSKLGNAF